MRFLTLLLVTAALSACNRPEAVAPPAASTPAEAPAEAAAAPAVDPNCAFCADPGFVRTCDVASGVPTTLYWNVADTAIQEVGIYVVDDAGKDSAFAQQPSKGSIATGPWLKPGLTCKLKAPDGSVLNTIVIAGKDC